MKTICILSIVLSGMLFSFPGVAQDLASAGLVEKNVYVPGTENKVAEENDYRWEFLLSVKDDFSAEEYQHAEKSSFGKELGCLLNLYESSSVKKEQVVEGDPTIRTMIRKPAVYNSVKNIEKYYKKRVKDNSFSEADRAQFEHVIKVAISSLDTEETEEFEVLYKEAEQTAREEGFESIANSFHYVRIAEEHHAKRYKQLYETVCKNTVFAKDSETTWICRKCGYVCKNSAAPEYCPNCFHPQNYFQVLCEKY